MKKLLIASLVVGLLAVFILPALAQEQNPDDCNLSFNVDVVKNKKINIEKNVVKNFEYNLNVGSTFSVFPLQLAEVEAFKCDENVGNKATVIGMRTLNNIVNSFNSFVGVAQVNQASGFQNNQGNIFAAGFTNVTNNNESTFWGVSMVEAAVEKANIGNALIAQSIITQDNISNSFNSFVGVAQVNQASGFQNNQNNVVVLGTNLNTAGLMAENDTFLSMNNTGNEVTLSTIQSTATISGSFNSMTGLAQVNQGPGGQNNQANIISIAHAGQ